MQNDNNDMGPEDMQSPTTGNACTFWWMNVSNEVPGWMEKNPSIIKFKLLNTFK